MKLSLCVLPTIIMFCSAHAEIKGLVDVRAVSADATGSWLSEGLGKQRFDDQHQGFQLGQAVIEYKSQLGDTLNGKIVFNGYQDRNDFVDITEAYLQWKPLPVNGYKFKLKLGAFFPTLSLENNGIGWTNPWMLSSSAINTWVGEELRTIGSEFSFNRSGLLNNSAHDVEIISAVFLANDPAGGLLSWRGWSVGDRITGLTETLPYPELPEVFGYDGVFTYQHNSEQPFHELDHHYGYYLGANYSYNGWLNVHALHYNNRGNPLVFDAGQYAWAMTFDHLAIKIDLPHDIALMSQIMQGNTKMGSSYNGVNADFNAWYLLASQTYGAHRFSIRYDNFKVQDKGQIEDDDNTENGHSLAATWLLSFSEQHQFGVEYLDIISKRVGRAHWGQTQNEAAGLPITETSLQIFYRFKF